MVYPRKKSTEPKGESEMNEEIKAAEKCSSCGQPIPVTKPDCPNCGRKRKTPTGAADLY
jgi:hypothetical protein